MQYVDDQTSLIQSLFSASTGAGWQDFLTPLRDFTQADGAMLHFQPVRGTAQTWSIGVDCLALQDQMPSLRFDRVYGQEDLTTTRALDGFFRMVKVRADGGATASLCILREAHRRDFRSPDRQFLTTVSPFLGQCLSTWARLTAERGQANQSEHLLANLGAGWVITDLTGNIQSMSPNIDALRAFRNMRISERLRLEFADPEMALRFRTAFAACATQGTATVIFTADVGTELTLQRQDAEILVRLRETPDHAALPAAAFAQHFGLNRSEGRLAALICDGHSLKSAAKVLGWTDETARSCSKAIFARMGVQGQTGLLRRVLTSGVTLD